MVKNLILGVTLARLAQIWTLFADFTFPSI